MIDYQAIKDVPLAFPDYFAEWGAKPWQKFVELGIRRYLGEDFSGKSILEIGPGNGRICCLFALLGARVTGLDISKERLDEALSTVKNFGLEDKISLICYDGNPGILDREKYDIIFTKSALICVDNLAAYLNKLNQTLKDGGKFVFIENARGNIIWKVTNFLRRSLRPSLRKTQYFGPEEASLIKESFNAELVMRSKLPPIYLFCGKKK